MPHRVKRVLRISYQVTAAFLLQPTGYRGQGYTDAPDTVSGASVEISGSSLVRGLPGEPLPAPNSVSGTSGEIRTGGFVTSPIKATPPKAGTPRRLC